MSKQLKIEVQSKIYTDTQKVGALGDVEFTVEPGEFVCILGPSGCGKSTLLRLISGLDTDFEGKIVLGDRLVKSPEKDCGIVFQEPGLLPWMSVKENIKFGIYSGQKEHSEGKVDNLLKLLDLDSFSESYPSLLSGGMAQKVGLARALVNIPDLLLLDEPFASLDKLTKMRLQEELSKILRDAKATVLMVTHDIEEAVYLSDRILVMSERPGTILKSFKIDLPKPRRRTDKEFTDIYTNILEFMRDELKLF